jgi:hypothetical protein
MLTAIGGSSEAAKKLVRHLTADDQFFGDAIVETQEISSENLFHW